MFKAKMMAVCKFLKILANSSETGVIYFALNTLMNCEQRMGYSMRNVQIANLKLINLDWRDWKRSKKKSKVLKFLLKKNLSKICSKKRKEKVSKKQVFSFSKERYQFKNLKI